MYGLLRFDRHFLTNMEQDGDSTVCTQRDYLRLTYFPYIQELLPSSPFLANISMHMLMSFPPSAPKLSVPILSLHFSDLSPRPCCPWCNLHRRMPLLSISHLNFSLLFPFLLLNQWGSLNLLWFEFIATLEQTEVSAVFDMVSSEYVAFHRVRHMSAYVPSWTQHLSVKRLVRPRPRAWAWIHAMNCVNVVAKVLMCGGLAFLMQPGWTPCRCLWNMCAASP